MFRVRVRACTDRIHARGAFTRAVGHPTPCGLRRRCGVKCGPLLRMVRLRPDDEKCDVLVSEPLVRYVNPMHSQWHVTARSLRSSVCVAVTTLRTGALSGCLLEASRATVVEYNVEPRVLADVYGLPIHIAGLRCRGAGHPRRIGRFWARRRSYSGPTRTGWERG